MLKEYGILRYYSSSLISPHLVDKILIIRRVISYKKTHH